jgi:hypothetical protein
MGVEQCASFTNFTFGVPPAGDAFMEAAQEEASEALPEPEFPQSTAWPLTNIPSGNELSNTPTASSPKTLSWKTSSGRTYGKEGYKLGDLTRTLVIKGRNKRRSDSGGGQVEEHGETWSGALVIEQAAEETTNWVEVADVPRLDSVALNNQSLEAAFHKHHSAPFRGRLVPKWSLRYYELKAGILQYRRKEGGKLVGSICLDGARVIAEPIKASRIGDCFVFRIIMRSEIVARLSCTDRRVAAEWVLSASAACAYFRSHVRTPPVEECLPAEVDAGKETEITGTVEAAASTDSQLQLMHQGRAPRLSLDTFMALLARRPAWPQIEFWPCAKKILPLLFVLLAVRRLRRRALALASH